MSMTPAVRQDLLRTALISILPVALATAVTAGVCADHFALSNAYLPRVMLVFVVGATLVLIGLPRHHPFHSFGAANLTTMARGALVALLAGLTGERSRDVLGFAVVAAAVAAGLDGLDGWLARRSHMASVFGARFDMETDALLILVLAVLAWQWGKAGPWVLACGLMRYAFVAAGWLAPRLRQPLPPSQRRKTMAVVQLVALIVALTPVVPAGVCRSVAAAGLVVLTFSFGLDLAWLIRNAPRCGAAVSDR